MIKTASLKEKYMCSSTNRMPSGSRKAGIGLFALQASADAVFLTIPVTAKTTYILSPINNNYSRRPGLSCADGVTVCVTAAGRSV